jgi:hypothetical protein
VPAKNIQYPDAIVDLTTGILLSPLGILVARHMSGLDLTWSVQVVSDARLTLPKTTSRSSSSYAWLCLDEALESTNDPFHDVLHEKWLTQADVLGRLAVGRTMACSMACMYAVRA